MKVLVYGAGVIGSYLAHVLCAGGNDTSVVARGKWKEQLEQNGLRIRHHLQRRETLDHPQVIERAEENEPYDAVFAVMPCHRIGAVLEPLAEIQTPIVILVGNNMSPSLMRGIILEKTVCPKKVLFGFQATAGKRDMERGMLICERAGEGRLDIGELHGPADPSTKEKLDRIFRGTGYQLCWQPDMEAYLISHLAAILPIGYLAYACGGDLTRSSASMRRLMRLASGEAYGMLKSRGMPILPANAEQYYLPGMKGTLMTLVYFVMAKSRTIGDLIACEHCRNAVEEMEMLDQAFEKIITESPGYPMPNWKKLKAQMPDWDTVREQYRKDIQRRIRKD